MFKQAIKVIQLNRVHSYIVVVLQADHMVWLRDMARRIYWWSVGINSGYMVQPVNMGGLVH